MITKDFINAPGHWFLARMGKNVLRPGGKLLTKKLLAHLNFEKGDYVVEFAPGVGLTANYILKNKNINYTGIDADLEVINFLQNTFKQTNALFTNKNATDTQLPDNIADKVLGEAMLTMQTINVKEKIIIEANRILKTGGLYGIHELALSPDTIDTEIKSNIQHELAITIKVNARPLTIKEWIETLENNHFKIRHIETNDMKLLEPRRIIQDEGFFKAMKIAWNILSNPFARERALKMRRLFNKYKRKLKAVVIIAEKIN